MSEYNVLGFDVKDIQAKILEVAIEFDRICRKYNISYSLDGGNLIGAVRHKGFIPWDDDLDVMMLRKDYQKFIKVCKKELDKEKFVLETPKLNKNYPYSFGKLKLKNTFYREAAFEDLKICHGIYIDIFPMDNTFKKTYRMQWRFAEFFKYVRWKKLKHTTKNNWSIKLFSIFPMCFINFCAEISMRFYNGIKTKYVYKLCHPGKHKPLFLRSYYENIIDIDFENQKLMALKDYKQWLSERFGDYMTLPPIEKRKPSHIVNKVKL